MSDPVRASIGSEMYDVFPGFGVAVFRGLIDQPDQADAPMVIVGDPKQRPAHRSCPIARAVIDRYHQVMAEPCDCGAGRRLEPLHISQITEAIFERMKAGMAAYRQPPWKESTETGPMIAEDPGAVARALRDLYARRAAGVEHVIPGDGSGFDMPEEAACVECNDGGWTFVRNRNPPGWVTCAACHNPEAKPYP